MTDRSHLYGVRDVHEERLFWTADAAITGMVEQAIDDWVDLRTDPIPDGPIQVERYSTHHPRTHFPDAEDILERILEWAADGEVTEDWCHHADALAEDDQTLAAIELAVDIVASKIDFRMADRVVAIETYERFDGEWIHTGTDDVIEATA